MGYLFPSFLSFFVFLTMSKSQLGYWKIRGLAHPIRFLCEYTKEPYEDVHYVQGDDFSREEWLSVKFTLGLDFPNLPYWIEPSGFKITESGAIIRHIARKHDLLGKTPEEKTLAEQMAGVIEASRGALTRFCYSQIKTAENKEEAISAYMEGFSKRIATVSKYLETRQWSAGDTLTFVDFQVYEVVSEHMVIFDFQPDGVLTSFMSNFENLPGIKEYMASDRYFKSPCNNKSAGLGGKP